MTEREMNEFILSLPEDFLEVTNSGRLDYPKRMNICLGKFDEICDVCFRHCLFFQRGAAHGIQYDEVTCFCSSSGYVPKVKEMIGWLIKKKVDELTDHDYYNIILPIIVGLYNEIDITKSELLQGGDDPLEHDSGIHIRLTDR